MLNKKIGLIALLTSVAAGGVWAGTIASYATGDVLVCFQKAGVDMVVDAGPVTTFTGATHNQVIPITQFTGTQLAQVGTNGVSWSAFTWLGDNTLFVTKGRSSVNQQTTPWVDASSPVQYGTTFQMGPIPPGALDQLNIPTYAVSTSTAVVEQGNVSGVDAGNYPDGDSYQNQLAGAYGGNFDGTFQGNPENTTSNNFTLKASPVRSDFYQLTPNGGHQTVLGTWLGYFEFETNGTMNYVAYPTTMPVINTVSRSGATATINYKTGLYGTYTLLGTNKISAPLSTWPVVNTLSTGDTSFHNYLDTDSVNTNKFYIIEGQ
jgi:hypothetical protein